jgi:hypothetical protein
VVNDGIARDEQLAAADLVRLIEDKIPDAVIFQTNIQDSHSIVAGNRKYEDKGCATIIVLPGR